MNVDECSEIYLLGNSISVPATFFNRILRHLEARIPQLERGVGYTLKQICGSHFWEPMSDGERRRAGQCANDMVERGLVPLIAVETSHEYPKRYERK